MILPDWMLRSKNNVLCNDKDINLHIGPGSIDLHLSNHFKFPDHGKRSFVLGRDKMKYKDFSLNGKDGLVVIPPLSFCLASTIEEVNIPHDQAAIVAGRSSIARVGLQVEAAGYIDSGFEGTITLELFNQHKDIDILLQPGTRIAQIIFFRMADDCENPYKGKYLGQHVTTESRMEEDDEFRPI